MLGIRELTIYGIFLRILFSIILGGIIGFERGLKNRPAGFRTYILVSIGACVVMLISFLHKTRNADLEIRNIQKESFVGYSQDSFAFVVTINGKSKRKNQEQMVETLRNIDGVLFIEIL